VIQNYRFSDLKIGQSAEFEVSVTLDMLNEFVRISGDKSPIHVDETFAQAKGFKGRVVHGFLLGSFYSQFVGVHLPGENTVLQKTEMDFHNPVYVGEKLKVQGAIDEIFESVQSVVIKAKILNESGKTVSKAKLMVGVK
jgi:acyl dehydratase